jgi:hypothetical protein
MDNQIEISVAMTDEEAWAYAQFLKRVGLNDYKTNAQNEAEAYLMLQVGEKVRKALAENGYSPR